MQSIKQRNPVRIILAGVIKRNINAAKWIRQKAAVIFRPSSPKYNFSSYADLLMHLRAQMKKEQVHLRRLKWIAGFSLFWSVVVFVFIFPLSHDFKNLEKVTATAGSLFWGIIVLATNTSEKLDAYKAAIDSLELRFHSGLQIDENDLRLIALEVFKKYKLP